MKQITLNNFSLMKEGSPTYYAENFGIETNGASRVLVPKHYATKFLDEDTATMKKEAGNVIDVVQGMDALGTGLADRYYYIIDGNSNVWVSGYNAAGYKLINTNESCSYPDIKGLGYGTDDSVVFAHNDAVGRIYRGVATGGSTTTLEDSSVDFTTLGLVAGDVVYNVTDNKLFTINAGGIAANTLTITAVAGSAGGSFASTESWAILDPDWAALTDNESTYSRQIIEFDEDFYILNGDALAKIVYGGAYDTTGFTAEYKSLEAGWIAQSAASNGDTICIGANKNSLGKLFIWDKNSNGWNKKIALENEVVAVTTYKNGYIYLTQGSIYFTDGYSTRLLSMIPGATKRSTITSNPKGIMVLEDCLLVLGGQGGFSRLKYGVRIYDIAREEWTYCPFDDTGTLGLAKHSYGSTAGIWFWDSELNVLFYSFSRENGYGGSSQYVLDKFLFDSPIPQGTFITSPIHLGKNSQIKKIEVNLIPRDSDYDCAETMSVVVSCKLSDCHKPVWRYIRAKVESATAGVITVNGTTDGSADSEVGDEIMCVQGYNGFLRRTIDSATGVGTATEVWTLDSALPNVTLINTYIAVSPFKKCGMESKTITTSQGTLEWYPYFIGDNVMLELTVLGTTNYPTVCIESIRIFYE